VTSGRKGTVIFFNKGAETRVSGVNPIILPLVVGGVLLAALFLALFYARRHGSKAAAASASH